MSDTQSAWVRLRREFAKLVRQEIAGRKLVRLTKRHKGVPDTDFGVACLLCGVPAPCPPAATAIRRFKAEFGDYDSVSR